MSPIKLIVKQVGERKRFSIHIAGRMPISLREFCNKAKDISYQSLHARLRELRPGDHFGVLEAALREMKSTIKSRAEFAAERAARPGAPLTGLQKRMAMAAMKHAAAMGELLGYRVTFTPIGPQPTQEEILNGTSESPAGAEPDQTGARDSQTGGSGPGGLYSG